MAANNERVASQLNGLRRLCVAGEKGFEVVAANVSNRGLKVLLKSYAQQRASFVVALQDEIESLGGSWSERRSARGVIHRGRINIFAALTIGTQSMHTARGLPIALAQVLQVVVVLGMLVADAFARRWWSSP